jgi:hypothetical protein
MNIKTMQEGLDLFKTIHGRMPNNSEEFANWMELIQQSSTSLNSRRPIDSKITNTQPKTK